MVVVRSAWDAIMEQKHPEMRGRETEVEETLANPDIIRFSVSRRHTLMFYRSTGQRRWVVAVTRREGEEGYLVTTYESTNIKSGDLAWQK
ncbi:hypothetical protein [Candidatus Amarobacter glycogenicus]|nr:hypothetical protein [Dehalococcoidia bacterium]